MFEALSCGFQLNLLRGACGLPNLIHKMKQAQGVGQPSSPVGSASRSLSGNQANKVVFNGSPSEYSGPQSAKPGLFSAAEPASVFQGYAGVVAGTVVRRWRGKGGGRRWCPGVLFSGAVSSRQVAGPVAGGASQICVPPGSETDLSDAERYATQFCGSAPAAETDFGGAQCLPCAGPSRYDPKCGQREVADVQLASSTGASGHVGTDARRVGSFGSVAQQACSAGVPLVLKLMRFSPVVLRVHPHGSHVSTLHSIICVSFSHARMSHARCVVNSVGDTEDGGRLSCVPGGTKSLSTSTRCGVRRPAVDELAHPQQAPLKLHEEAWAGLLQNQGLGISQEVEIVPGCAVLVACPSCPDHSSEPPGPGRIIRNTLGWSPLEETDRSGVWFLRAIHRIHLHLTLVCGRNSGNSSNSWGDTEAGGLQFCVPGEKSNRA